MVKETLLTAVDHLFPGSVLHHQIFHLQKFLALLMMAVFALAVVTVAVVMVRLMAVAVDFFLFFHGLRPP